MARHFAPADPAGYCEPSQQRNQQGHCRSGVRKNPWIGPRADRWNKRSIRRLVREDYATFGRLVKDLDIKAE
jgi:hypothetical protein